MDNNCWPPANGKKYIQSDEFGALLVELTKYFMECYPDRDFTDGVAHVFAWLDKKLTKNRRFINKRRFPTHSSFRAYMRQAIWNASRIAERSRRRIREIEVLSSEGPIANETANDIILDLQRAINGLPEPHRMVFERFFYDEEPLKYIAQTAGLSLRNTEAIYAQAVDKLAIILGL